MQKDKPSALLFPGRSHPQLAQEVVSLLSGKEGPLSLGSVNLGHFPDGEIAVQLLESVRGRDTFVLQTIALNPNEYLVELLIMIDALKRASAASITAVIPYYGYCRQDRKDKPRVPITAKLVAELLQSAGATRVLTVDLHAGQLQGFFDVPVDHLHGKPCVLKPIEDLKLDNLVVVCPDIGSVKLARSYARYLGAELAVIDKQRLSDARVESVILMGDVKGKNVLLADDMCSTGGTLVSAAKACHEKGAKRIFAAVTHGLFVGDSVAQIDKSPIEALIVSNTVPYTDRLSGSTKIQMVSISPLLAQAIHCILSQEALGSLLGQENI